MYRVYILYSTRIDKYYIGQTKDLPLRISYHNSIDRNRIWSKRGIPWIKKVSFSLSSRAEAVALEKYLKQLKNRKLIEGIISDKIIIWNGRAIEADPDSSG
jgi:putative endonuclease